MGFLHLQFGQATAICLWFFSFLLNWQPFWLRYSWFRLLIGRWNINKHQANRNINSKTKILEAHMPQWTLPHMNMFNFVGTFFIYSSYCFWLSLSPIKQFRWTNDERVKARPMSMTNMKKTNGGDSTNNNYSQTLFIIQLLLNICIFCYDLLIIFHSIHVYYVS